MKIQQRGLMNLEAGTVDIFDLVGDENFTFC